MSSLTISVALAPQLRAQILDVCKLLVQKNLGLAAEVVIPDACHAELHIEKGREVEHSGPRGLASCH